MNYHIPKVIKNVGKPDFFLRNNELIIPQNILTTEEYPTLKQTLVKIVAQNGSNIFVPIQKLRTVSSADV